MQIVKGSPGKPAKKVKVKRRIFLSLLEEREALLKERVADKAKIASLEQLCEQYKASVE